MAKVKLCRLRDIVLYHLKEHEGTEKNRTTVGQIQELEDDLIVWIKNWVMFNEELDIKSSVQFIGEENAYEN